MSPIEQELERRLALLPYDDKADRRLPQLDTLILAALTIGSLVIVLVAQAL